MIAIGGRAVDVLDLPGDPGRPALVLLHEALGSVGLWRTFPAALHAATGRRVVAYSRFGHGRSAPRRPGPRDESFFDEQGDLLGDVLATLDVERPVLVGHSDGATIALVHAAAHEVAGLVLMAPHVVVEAEMLPGLEEAVARFHDGDLRERMARHHDDPVPMFEAWSGFWLRPETRAWSIEAQIEAVRAPALLVQGAGDEYATLGQLDRIEARVSGPTTRLVLDGGHSPHLEHEATVVDAIGAFLATLEAR